MTMLIEIDRGYDRKSINRHSWREYKLDNYPHHFVIEKCTDALPVYFEAYLVYGLTGRVIEHIKINNNVYWMDGWKILEKSN